MAEHASDYTRGDMDIEAHKASFHAFVLMSKWGSLTIASGLLFFTMWFCTSAGFLAALVSAVVVAVVGTLILREKPGAAH